MNNNNKQSEELNIDITKLSAKQIKELEKQIHLHHEAEREEKVRLASVKSNYKLHIPSGDKIEISRNDYGLIRQIIYRVAINPESKPFNKDVLLGFLQNNLEPERIPFSRIYECPHCGKVALSSGREWIPDKSYDGGHNGDYYIGCNNCEWETPKKLRDDYEDGTWEKFHQWLIHNGFLASDTSFPSETINKTFRQYLQDNPEQCLSVYGLSQRSSEQQ